MILQRFYTAMLTNKYNLLAHAISRITLTAIFTFAVSATYAHAETSQDYKQEPITPIPQTIEVNAAKAKLGETLFFDTRLSINNTISCATCHQLEAGGDDNMAMGVSLASGKHVINTPTVFNSRYNFRQNWDGSAASLVEQIEMVMASHHEFNNQWDNLSAELNLDKKLKKKFKAIYKTGLTRKNIVNAIVEYEKTLITPNSPFDKYLRNEDGALSKKRLKVTNYLKNSGASLVIKE